MIINNNNNNNKNETTMPFGWLAGLVVVVVEGFGLNLKHIRQVQN